MEKILMFNMPFETKHFNKNQKVWVQETTGAMAAKVVGKFMGKGKYVSAWVNWNRCDRKKYPIPEFKEFDVDDSFAKKHGILLINKSKD